MISECAPRQLAETWSQRVILVSVSKLNFIFLKSHINAKKMRIRNLYKPRRRKLQSEMYSRLVSARISSKSFSSPARYLGHRTCHFPVTFPEAAHAYVTRFAKITRHRSGTQDARKSIVAWRRKGGGRRRRGGQEGER